MRAGDIAAKFFSAVLARPEIKALLAGEHCSVDGTLIEAWAGMKSFRFKGKGEADGGAGPGGGRTGARDFHGEQPSNATHASTTDPAARLCRKGRGREAKLCHMGHLLLANRHGLTRPRPLPPAAPRGKRWPCSGVSPAATAPRSAAPRPPGSADFVAA